MAVLAFPTYHKDSACSMTRFLSAIFKVWCNACCFSLHQPALNKSKLLDTSRAITKDPVHSMHLQTGGRVPKVKRNIEQTSKDIQSKLEISTWDLQTGAEILSTQYPIFPCSRCGSDHPSPTCKTHKAAFASLPRSTYVHPKYPKKVGEWMFKKTVVKLFPIISNDRFWPIPI